MIGLKTMPSGLEFGAQLGVIVNLAVEGDHQLVVQGGHRLRSGGDIENRQASVPEKDPGVLVDPGAFPVRAAMGKHIDHSMQNAVLASPDKSGNTAHLLAFGVQRSALNARRSGGVIC